jgi:hypothetical protein
MAALGTAESHPETGGFSSEPNLGNRTKQYKILKWIMRYEREPRA